jgi:hypothetical protein
MFLIWIGVYAEPMNYVQSLIPVGSGVPPRLDRAMGFRGGEGLAALPSCFVFCICSDAPLSSQIRLERPGGDGAPPSLETG